MRMKMLALAVLSAVSAFAQYDTYTVGNSVSLTAQSHAVCVQLPATGNNDVQIVDFTVGPSAAARITIERDSSSACSGGELTPGPNDPETSPLGAPTWKVFSGASLPAGSGLLSPPSGWAIPAGSIVPFNGSRRMTGSGTNRNFIIRLVGPYTGTFDYQLTIRARRS